MQTDFDVLNSLAGKGDMKAHIHTLYGICRGVKPKIALEIGVRKGVSTIALLLGIRFSGGLLYSIDIDACEGAKKRIEQLGLSSFWNFTKANSQTYNDWKDKPIDLLFIDGDHSFSGVSSDFFKYFPFVRENGLILMHDAYCPREVAEREKVEGHHFVERLTEQNYLYYKGFITAQIELCTLPYCNGLTIIRKVS